MMRVWTIFAVAVIVAVFALTAGHAGGGNGIGSENTGDNEPEGFVQEPAGTY